MEWAEHAYLAYYYYVYKLGHEREHLVHIHSLRRRYTAFALTGFPLTPTMMHTATTASLILSLSTYIIIISLHKYYI